MNPIPRHDLPRPLPARRRLQRVGEPRGVGHDDAVPPGHGERAHAGRRGPGGVVFRDRVRADAGLEEHAGGQGAVPGLG